MAQDNNELNDRDQGNNEGGRGFEKMDPKKRKEISSQGGKAAHDKGTAHEWDSGEAKEAGRKGGSSGGSNQNQ